MDTERERAIAAALCSDSYGCTACCSYKRMVENAWAPVVATWGVENRTAALRAINLSPKATRIEVRVGGADINSYLCIGPSMMATRERDRERVRDRQSVCVYVCVLVTMHSSCMAHWREREREGTNGRRSLCALWPKMLQGGQWLLPALCG
jgi:hypothetical protein